MDYSPRGDVSQIFCTIDRELCVRDHPCACLGGACVLAHELDPVHQEDDKDAPWDADIGRLLVEVNRIAAGAVGRRRLQRRRGTVACGSHAAFEGELDPTALRDATRPKAVLRSVEA